MRFLSQAIPFLSFGTVELPSTGNIGGARTAVGNMNAPERHLKRISLLEEEAAQPCRGIQYLSKCSLPTYRENIHVLHMVQERTVNKIRHVADPFLFPRSCPAPSRTDDRGMYPKHSRFNEICIQPCETENKF